MGAEELSISGLLRAGALADPGCVALIEGPVQLTRAQLDAATSQAANALLGLGLTAGDRVALQLGTGRDFVVCYLGALRAGLVVVPINPGYTAAELGQILADSGAAVLITVSVAAIEAELLGVDEVIVAARVAPEGRRTLAELLAAASSEDPRADRAGEDVAVLLYTSGTSGRPKGAMLSARALLANLEQVARIRPAPIGADDIAFLALPLFHIFGLNGGLGVALRAGATLVLADRFDPAASLATLARERVSVLLGAPAMFAQWADEPDFAAAFATVRFALSGSAPLPAELAARYAAAGITLHEGYGLTEAAPGVTITAGSAPGSIGRPLPGVEIELRDADGDPVGDEDADPGELFVRGANLFSGYWPDGAAGPDAEGWWGTGDIAVREPAGGLRIVGRTTDLVLVNGFNVYPAEVEAVLGAQAGVVEAAVFGVDDPVTGEAVVAYVVPSADATLDPATLREAAARSLAPFKVPRAIEIVAQLPHTVTGKVMKWRLREDNRSGASS